MSSFSLLLRRMAGWVFRALLLAAGLVFMVSLLLALLVAALWSLLLFALTGRKPRWAVQWQRVQQWRQQAPWSRRPAGQQAGNPTDVVDVDARDVTPPTGRLPRD